LLAAAGGWLAICSKLLATNYQKLQTKAKLCTQENAFALLHIAGGDYECCCNRVGPLPPEL